MADKTWSLLQFNWWFWRLYYFEDSGIRIGTAHERMKPLRARKIYLFPPGIPLIRESNKDMRHFYVHFYIPEIPVNIWSEIMAPPFEINDEGGMEALAKEIMGHCEKRTSFHNLPVLSLVSMGIFKALNKLDGTKRKELSKAIRPPDRIRASRDYAVEKRGIIKVAELATFSG